MRIAPRLMLVLACAVVLIVGGYMLVSHRQRQALLREGMVRDTETLGRALRTAIGRLPDPGRIAAAHELLGAAVDGDESIAGAVLDPAGAVLAGELPELACLRPRLADGIRGSVSARGWADCGHRTFWLAKPLGEPAGWLVLARRAVLLEQAAAAALRGQALLLLALTAAVGLLLGVLLDRMVFAPLAAMRRSILAIGQGRDPPRLRLAADELGDLAASLNQVADRTAEQGRELRHRAENTVGLERRLREAERFAVIGRLSGGLAHEMGSPLSVIGIRAEAVTRDPGASASIRQHAGFIGAEVRRLSEFVQGLLHMERRHPIVYDRLDLVRLLRSVLDEAAPRAASLDVRVTLNLPDAPVLVRGQEALLRHVLRNLLSNALHALAGLAGERRLEVRLEARVHEARVLVEDNGPGIAPELMDRVFEPFFTTSGRGGGMGLGLPVSRGIVEEHGGELFLENRDRRGVRAVLALPAAGSDSPVASGSPAGESGAAVRRAQARPATEPDPSP